MFEGVQLPIEYILTAVDTGTKQVIASQRLVQKSIAETNAASARGASVQGRASASSAASQIASLKKMESATAKAGKAMTKFLTLPLLGIGVVGAKMALDFGENMKLIQTQAGGSAKDVKVLTKAVLELGKSTTQGPIELSKGLFHLKSVGMNNVDAMRALKVASEGAMMGMADLETTTSTLAGVWKTNIKGAGDFKNVMATLGGIVGSGNLRMQDLVGAIGTGILPTMKSAGLSIQDFGAAIATATARGVPATQMATRLRTGLMMLAAPSAKAETAMNQVGLSGLKMAHDFRQPQGLLVALRDIKDHLDRIQDPAKRFQLASKMFGGARGASTVLMLLDGLKEMGHQYDRINKAQADYNKNLAAAKAEPLNKLKVAWSQLRVQLIEVGDRVLPFLTKAAHWVGVLIDKFNNLSPGAKKFVGIIATIALLAGPLLRIIALVTKLRLLLLGLGGAGAAGAAGAGAGAAGGMALGRFVPVLGALVAAYMAKQKLVDPAAKGDWTGAAKNFFKTYNPATAPVYQMYRAATHIPVVGPALSSAVNAVNPWGGGGKPPDPSATDRYRAAVERLNDVQRSMADGSIKGATANRLLKASQDELAASAQHLNAVKAKSKADAQDAAANSKIHHDRLVAEAQAAKNAGMSWREYQNALKSGGLKLPAVGTKADTGFMAEYNRMLKGTGTAADLTKAQIKGLNDAVLGLDEATRQSVHSGKEAETLQQKLANSVDAHKRAVSFLADVMHAIANGSIKGAAADRLLKQAQDAVGTSADRLAKIRAKSARSDEDAAVRAAVLGDKLRGLVTAAKGTTNLDAFITRIKGIAESAKRAGIPALQRQAETVMALTKKIKAVPPKWWTNLIMKTTGQKELQSILDHYKEIVALSKKYPSVSFKILAMWATTGMPGTRSGEGRNTHTTPSEGRAGGWAARLAAGGWVPGDPRQDGTLAYLSGNEFVATGPGQQQAVQAGLAHPALWDWLAQNQAPHFAKGGYVGGTAFGGPGDPGTGNTGYRGDDLRKKPWSFAELSTNTGAPLSKLNFAALGHLAYLTKLLVTNPVSHLSAVLSKRDVGRGGGPVKGGYARKIDLWYQAANALKFSGFGPLQIAKTTAKEGASKASASTKDSTLKWTTLHMATDKLISRADAWRAGYEGSVGSILPDMARATGVVRTQHTKDVPGTDVDTTGLGGGATKRLARMIGKANQITARHYPYVLGGGHGKVGVGPYDCSGAVDAVLNAGGFPVAGWVSGNYVGWAKAGKGKHVTTYAKPGVGSRGHVWMELNGRDFGTSRTNTRYGGGAAWFSGGVTGPPFVARHPAGFRTGGFVHPAGFRRGGFGDAFDRRGLGQKMNTAARSRRLIRLYENQDADVDEFGRLMLNAAHIPGMTKAAGAVDKAYGYIWYGRHKKRPLLGGGPVEGTASAAWAIVRNTIPALRQGIADWRHPVDAWKKRTDAGLKIGMVQYSPGGGAVMKQLPKPRTQAVARAKAVAALRTRTGKLMDEIDAPAWEANHFAQVMAREAIENYASGASLVATRLQGKLVGLGSYEMESGFRWSGPGGKSQAGSIMHGLRAGAIGNNGLALFKGMIRAAARRKAGMRWEHWASTNSGELYKRLGVPKGGPGSIPGSAQWHLTPAQVRLLDKDAFALARQRRGHRLGGFVPRFRGGGFVPRFAGGGRPSTASQVASLFAPPPPPKTLLGKIGQGGNTSAVYAQVARAQADFERLLEKATIGRVVAYQKKLVKQINALQRGKDSPAIDREIKRLQEALRLVDFRAGQIVKALVDKAAAFGAAGESAVAAAALSGRKTIAVSALKHYDAGAAVVSSDIDAGAALQVQRAMQGKQLRTLQRAMAAAKKTHAPKDIRDDIQAQINAAMAAIGETDVAIVENQVQFLADVAAALDAHNQTVLGLAQAQLQLAQTTGGDTTAAFAGVIAAQRTILDTANARLAALMNDGIPDALQADAILAATTDVVNAENDLAQSALAAAAAIDAHNTGVLGLAQANLQLAQITGGDTAAAWQGVIAAQGTILETARANLNTLLTDTIPDSLQGDAILAASTAVVNAEVDLATATANAAAAIQQSADDVASYGANLTETSQTGGPGITSAGTALTTAVGNLPQPIKDYLQTQGVVLTDPNSVRRWILANSGTNSFMAQWGQDEFNRPLLSTVLDRNRAYGTALDWRPADSGAPPAGDTPVDAAQAADDLANKLIAGFERFVTLATLGQQNLELHQKIAGTYDTTGGAQERRRYILEKVMPAVQAEIDAIIAQLAKPGISQEERDRLVIELATKNNELLSDQLAADEEIKDNTKEIADQLKEFGGTLAFDFQGQQFTDKFFAAAVGS